MRKNAKSILLTVVSAVGLVCIMTGFSFAANYTDIDNNLTGMQSRNVETGNS